MKTLAVIVAQSRIGLAAVAKARGLKVIEDTIRQYDELGYFQDPPNDSNRINIGSPGWVAMARVP